MSEKTSASMKAARFERYGPPEVIAIREVARPEPGPGEILVRVVASTVSPAECAMRKADPFIARLFTGLVRPRSAAMGGDFAGYVEARGPGAQKFTPGEAVFGTLAPATGAHAHYLTIPEDGAVLPVPPTVTPVQAVALVDGFLTAMPFLRDHGKVGPGTRLVVNGASGSIGTVSVQLGKYLGAHVTGVCSRANVALVESLGADRVIDYGREDFTAAEGAYDVIFDAVGKSSFSRCRTALTPRGVYMTTVPGWGIVRALLATAKSRGRRAVFAATGLRKAKDKAVDLDVLGQMIAQGAIRAVIDRHYPLDEMAQAHAYVETERKVGAVVIDMG